MIEEFYNYFTIETLFYWVNLGVLPFWLVLIFFPYSNLSRYFVTSIFPVLLLSGAYIFVLYKSYLNSYDFMNNFSLYLSIDHLLNLFSNKLYLMIFGYILYQLIYSLVGGLLKILKNLILIKFL